MPFFTVSPGFFIFAPVLLCLLGINVFLNLFHDGRACRRHEIRRLPQRRVSIDVFLYVRVHFRVEMDLLRCLGLQDADQDSRRQLRRHGDQEMDMV